MCVAMQVQKISFNSICSLYRYVLLLELEKALFRQIMIALLNLNVTLILNARACSCVSIN